MKRGEHRALVFDADGVVIHPWGFANALMNDYGIGPDKTRAFFTGPFRQCVVGEAPLPGSLDPFLAEWGWTGSVGELIDLWMRSENLPNAEVLSKVEALRAAGTRCYLASNQEAIRARYIATEMAFAQKFDGLFFSCELGTLKPQPAFYAAIESSLGLAGEQITFFDDTLGHVEAARERGWHAVHVREDDDLALIA